MVATLENTLRAFSVAALITLSASSQSLAQTSSGNPIQIGALLSVTGGLAGVGIPERDGVLFAAKVINERGGINGRPIKIILEDDGSNPDAAIPKINKLIHEDNVLAVMRRAVLLL
jgi:branched-chain amino acid transport system substrate-binding protein